MSAAQTEWIDTIMWFSLSYQHMVSAVDCVNTKAQIVLAKKIESIWVIFVIIFQKCYQKKITSYKMH